MSRSINKKFWSHDAIIAEILINGYTRSLYHNQHPVDIIKLIFQYYHTLIPSFTKHVLHEFNNNSYSRRDNEWLSIKEIAGNNTVSVALDKPFRIVMEPDVSSKWCSNSKLLSNGITHSLRYDFSIKYMENMYDHSIIGIVHYDMNRNKYNQSSYHPSRPYIKIIPKTDADIGNLETDLHRFNFGYFMKIEKSDDGERLAIFKSYTNFSKYYLVQPFNSGTEIISFAVDGDSNDEDIISLSVNCSTWKLTFLFNNEAIYSVDVNPNKSYIPVVWLFNDEKTDESEERFVKYQIESMKCFPIHPNKQKQVMFKKRKDMNKYIFKPKEYGTFLGSDKYISNDNINSSATIMKLLWNGYRFIYLPSNVPNITSLIGDMYKYSKTEMCLALETYQCFYEEYKHYILHILIYNRGVVPKIGLILVNFVIEDYNDDYLQYTMNPNIYVIDYKYESKVNKIKYDDLDLKLWDNMSNRPCPTCYFGGDYYQYFLEDKDNKKKEDMNCEAMPYDHDIFHEINNKLLAKRVDKKFKNRHRKKKYRQIKRRKLQLRSKKRKRRDLSLFAKQYHYSL